MDRNIRVQLIPASESDVAAQPVLMTPVVSPTTSTGEVSTHSADDQQALFSHYAGNYVDIPPPKVDFNAPPAYDVATDLPTYEDVQRQKLHEVGESRNQPDGTPSQIPSHSSRPFAFLALDNVGEGDGGNVDGSLLGTDFIFFTAFMVAFLFNWIGFLLLMCFCHTIAARYGALSGFGLSLAKWTFIVKHSTDLASHENNWLWWLIMAFGLLICVRAIIQYLHIKRNWRLLSRTAQERLIFFY